MDKEPQTPAEKRAVPPQEEGVQLDLSQSLTAERVEEAAQFFAAAKDRLSRINDWHLICGPASARFQLTDPHGEPREGLPRPGDYIRIGLPAPGSSAGEGYDWVRVELVESNDNPGTANEMFVLRVRPADNPHNDRDDVAHFYTDAATSTFMVERQGHVVTAGVHGRNEVPNVAQTESLADKARNALVALPALAGLAKVQWTSLIEGVLGSGSKE